MTRTFGFVAGIAFGFVLAWTQLTDPERIRHMLLLDEAYYYVLMAAAMAVGTVGARWLLRTRRATWQGAPLARRHVVGSVLFGIGWGISNACPGPIAAQLGQGLFWGFCTLGGFFVGARLHTIRVQRRESLPDAAPATR
jgi:uncharacterized membrane protein YedE/YeeE